MVMYIVQVLRGVRWSHSDQKSKNRQCIKVLQVKNQLHTYLHTGVMFTNKQQVWVGIRACLHTQLFVIYNGQACFIIDAIQLLFKTV